MSSDKVHVEISSQVLSDGSEVYDVILTQGDQEITINCTDERSAAKVFHAFDYSIKFFSVN